MKQNLHQVVRVMMIFTSTYDGHYARDLSHGFKQSKVEIGFISLKNAANPSWLERERALDFSDKIGVDASLLKKIIRTASIIRNFRPDVIQTHLFEGGIVGLLVGKLLRIPVIHTRHHIDEHYQSGTFIHRLIDRTVAKRSDHVVVCSKAAKKWLMDIEGVKESHITVINQGFDFSYLNPSPEEIKKAKTDLGFSEKNINIICVSRYSRAKGQNYLLLALHELVKTHPNISLTLMGPGDGNWLVELVGQLGLGKFVRILPSRNDVPACIAGSDMIIHPSLADSFSQLVIEAQAVGGLLVASDIAAVREQVLDGVTGVIVPPRDPQAIADAVHFLINNPESAISMRKKAPAHVRESFTWQRMVAEEIECFKNNIE